MVHPRGAGRLKPDEPRGKSGVEGLPEALRVWLLGSFRVLVGLRSIEEGHWRLKKAASLIKLLALAPEHRLHRERVMGLLWPELDSKAAANNLHYVLHRARRTLEPDRRARTSRYLLFRGELLALCPEVPLWVDVEAFEEAAALARQTREPSNYRAAVELYAGDLLPQDPYEAWAEDRREGLRRLYLRLLVELAGLYEEREDFQSAIETLDEAVVIEPAHEEAHAGLMLLYAKSGRRHEALLQYQRLRFALSEELNAEPGDSTRRLHEAIRTGELPAPRSAQERKEHPPEELPDDGQHNLPVYWTSFIGRERELVELKRMLASSWLVTLTGAGGSGKTRLALEAAKGRMEAYPDGVWRVDLVGLSEPELVPQAVSTTLKVREQPNRPLVDTLVGVLSTKKMLLILDNCEHLIGAVTRLVKALLKSCPGLRILATSREHLGVGGEVEWRVPPLSLPDLQRPLTVEGLSGYEAVRLFVERARLRLPSFALTAHNAWVVAEICQKLEGIPLAIELAAARVGALPVEQIAQRLEDSIGVVAAGSRTADPRHRTLHKTLDWSYELLSEPEKRVFVRLSVFRGGWTFKAAQTVAAGDDIEGEDVLDSLSELTAKSLVVTEPGEDEGALRYGMLEPVGQYAKEKLEESEEVEAVKLRHAAFFLALAEEAEPELKRMPQGEWLKRLEVEHGNLRAALSWALEGGDAGLGLRLGAALGWFWHLRGRLREGLLRFEAALASGEGPPQARLKALSWAGWLAWEQGAYERAVALSEEALALARELGDAAGIADALQNLGVATLRHNKLERASALLDEAVTLQRELEDTIGLVRSLQAQGLVAVVREDHDRAQELFEEGLALAREIEDQVGMALLMGLGALIALGRGEYERVKTFCARGLELSRQLGLRHGVVFMLHISASLAGAQERPVRAARLWGAAEALGEEIGVSLVPVERRHYGPYISAAHALLDEADWEAAWVQGRAMTQAEAVAYALAGEEEQTSATTPVLGQHPTGPQSVSLTRREREVASLVAHGLSNRQIAEELAISEHTAITHVRNILKKLGLHSRTQLAAWATDKQPLL